MSVSTALLDPDSSTASAVSPNLSLSVLSPDFPSSEQARQTDINSRYYMEGNSEQTSSWGASVLLAWQPSVIGTLQSYSDGGGTVTSALWKTPGSARLTDRPKERWKTGHRPGAGGASRICCLRTSLH